MFVLMDIQVHRQGMLIHNRTILVELVCKMFCWQIQITLLFLVFEFSQIKVAILILYIYMYIYVLKCFGYSQRAKVS